MKAEAGDSETIFKKETLASWRIIQNKDKQTYQLKKEALKKVNKTLVSDLDRELKGKKKSFKVDAVDQLLHNMSLPLYRVGKTRFLKIGKNHNGKTCF